MRLKMCTTYGSFPSYRLQMIIIYECLIPKWVGRLGYMLGHHDISPNNGCWVACPITESFWVDRGTIWLHLFSARRSPPPNFERHLKITSQITKFMRSTWGPPGAPCYQDCLMVWAWAWTHAQTTKQVLLKFGWYLGSDLILLWLNCHNQSARGKVWNIWNDIICYPSYFIRKSSWEY